MQVSLKQKVKIVKIWATTYFIWQIIAYTKIQHYFIVLQLIFFSLEQPKFSPKTFKVNKVTLAYTDLMESKCWKHIFNQNSMYQRF